MATSPGYAASGHSLPAAPAIPSAALIAAAAAFHWTGCDLRARSRRSPSRSRYHETVSSIASSWGEVVQPSSRLAFVLR